MAWITFGCYSWLTTHLFTDSKRTEDLLFLPAGKREPNIWNCLGPFEELLKFVL